jgi:hypothetical protein
MSRNWPVILRLDEGGGAADNKWVHKHRSYGHAREQQLGAAGTAIPASKKQPLAAPLLLLILLRFPTLRRHFTCAETKSRGQRLDASAPHPSLLSPPRLPCMLLDFEITNCSRQCATTGRTFAPGETYFSTLHMEGGSPVRRDYAASEWRGPSEGVTAWWKARTPESDSSKPKLAPQDVLLNLFVELADKPHEAEFRYVLGLLLLRRRLVKLEETRRDAGGEVLVLDCPRREEQYELRVVTPDAERVESLQQRMVELLYGAA